MVLITSTETARLIRDGEKRGKGVWRWREREIIYLSLHCICIKWAAMRAVLMFD